MRCTVCGAELKATRTDLPFKVRETSIVILKNLPVMQCGNCPEYLIQEHATFDLEVIHEYKGCSGTE